MQKLDAIPLRSGSVALMGATLPVASEAEVPEWIHLLPTASGRIETVDSRGPYFVRDAAQIIAASFVHADKLPIDENHATDLAAPEGRSAPARGWIVAMEARADGIWGKVEWTRAGREMLADHAYRGISPVIAHGAENVVRGILRASLVNNPNLRGLAALHQEGHVTFQTQLAELLGLNAAATEEEILGALPPKISDTTALQSAMPSIAEALGLAKDANLAAVTAAATAAGRDAKTLIPALQAQVTDLSTQLKALQDDGKKARAETFIDDAIKAGRMGLNAANRDEFVAMHQENPDRTERLVNGFAVMPGTTLARTDPPQTAAQHASADQLVAAAKALQAAEAAKGNSIDWITAVQMASEGKK